MAKLTLRLESLHVESFDTVAARENPRGTVIGAQLKEFTYLTCDRCPVVGFGSVGAGCVPATYSCACSGNFSCGCTAAPCLNETEAGS